jgi:hypothetical protein
MGAGGCVSEEGAHVGGREQLQTVWVRVDVSVRKEHTWAVVSNFKRQNECLCKLNCVEVHGVVVRA